jgi:hypothetical protein
VKRLRQLEQENQLKKMDADRDLELDVLKEITQQRWWAHARRLAERGSASRRFAQQAVVGGRPPWRARGLISRGDGTLEWRGYPEALRQLRTRHAAASCSA